MWILSTSPYPHYGHGQLQFPRMQAVSESRLAPTHATRGKHFYEFHCCRHEQPSLRHQYRDIQHLHDIGYLTAPEPASLI
jgi:hypothetical protein